MCADGIILYTENNKEATNSLITSKLFHQTCNAKLYIYLTQKLLMFEHKRVFFQPIKVDLNIFYAIFSLSLMSASAQIQLYVKKSYLINSPSVTDKNLVRIFLNHAVMFSRLLMVLVHPTELVILPHGDKCIQITVDTF